MTYGNILQSVIECGYGNILHRLIRLNSNPKLNYFGETLR